MNCNNTYSTIESHIHLLYHNTNKCMKKIIHFKQKPRLLFIVGFHYLIMEEPSRYVKAMNKRILNVNKIITLSIPRLILIRKTLLLEHRKFINHEK
jgi:hypothetical protein